MSTPTIMFQLTCWVRHDEPTDVFVSRCPSMNVYSQGETEDEALAAIKSAVGLYLKAAFQHDRLEQTLRRAGFASLSTEPVVRTPTEFVAFQSKPEMKPYDIEVPLALLAYNNQSASPSSNPS